MTDLIRDALLAGWSIRPTKKGYMLLPPNREIGPDGRNRCPGVLIHKTPSDRRTQNNVAAMIKRFGTLPEGPDSIKPRYPDAA